MKIILKLESKWYEDNLQLCRWSDASRDILKKAFLRIREKIIGKMSPYCMNLKGRGGVKGAVRCIYNKINTHPFAARFDIKSFYGSIDHNTLFRLLKDYDLDSSLLQTIYDYVEIPDSECKGIGIVAGGALSTLLGAVYLSPLDREMHKLYKKGSIFYLRYADDIVIMAKTRHHLKKSIKRMHEVLDTLRLEVHKYEKRFIGKTSKGFDFLGYKFRQGEKLFPSDIAIMRFSRNLQWLTEQGADKNRILLYFQRWLDYVKGGVKNIVEIKTARIISMNGRRSTSMI